MKMRQLDLLLRKALIVLQEVTVDIRVFVVLIQKDLQDVQILVPFTTKSSPSSTAEVVSEARSEPAFGSENPWQK